MSKKTYMAAIIISALLVSLVGMQCVEMARANDPNTITVPDDYSTIQEAINSAKAGDTVSSAVSNVSSVSSNPTVPNSCDVLLKTMTPEEQKVLNVLISHQGKYLQKYVGKEAGLSRLKTHRVMARFAQRGIVTVKEFGNTNEILLSDWVKVATISQAS